MKIGDKFLGRFIVGITDNYLVLESNVEKYPNTNTYKSVFIKYKLKSK